jgi:O-antigen ligase
VTTDRGTNQHRAEFLAAQVDSVGAQLAVASGQLRVEQETSGVFDPALVGKAELDGAARVREQLAAVQVEESALNAMLAQVSAGHDERAPARRVPELPPQPRDQRAARRGGQARDAAHRDARVARGDRARGRGGHAEHREPRAAARAARHRVRGRARAAAHGARAPGRGVRRRARRAAGQAESSSRLQREVRRLGQTMVALQTQLVEARLAAVGEAATCGSSTQRRRPSAGVPAARTDARHRLARGLFLGVLSALRSAFFGRWIRTCEDAERLTGRPDDRARVRRAARARRAAAYRTRRGGARWEPRAEPAEVAALLSRAAEASRSRALVASPAAHARIALPAHGEHSADDGDGEAMTVRVLPALSDPGALGRARRAHASGARRARRRAQPARADARGGGAARGRRALRRARAAGPPPRCCLGPRRSTTRSRRSGPRGRLRVATAIRFALPALLIGHLGRIPALASGEREAPLLANDIAVILMVACGLLACLLARSLVLDGPARAALAFAGVGAASAALAVPRFGITGAELLFSLAYLARWLLYFALYVVVVNGVRRRDVAGVWSALESTILIFAVFGIVQSIFLPGFAQIVYPESKLYVDWDPQGHRLVSTFLDPNFAGAFIAFGLLVLGAKMSAGVPVRSWKLVVLFAAMLMTASRSTMLAAFVGACVIVTAWGVSKRALRLLAALALGVVPFIPMLLEFARSYNKLTLDASALARVVAWARALTVFADNPVIGIGFNTYGFVQSAYGYERGAGSAVFSLDGGLLFIAVMTGFVGLAFYVAMLSRIVARCRRVWRGTDATADERGLALGVAASTAAVVVHSLFVNSLLVPFIMEPLWLLWALPFAIEAERGATDAA